MTNPVDTTEIALRASSVAALGDEDCVSNETGIRLHKEAGRQHRFAANHHEGEGYPKLAFLHRCAARCHEEVASTLATWENGGSGTQGEPEYDAAEICGEIALRTDLRYPVEGVSYY